MNKGFLQNLVAMAVVMGLASAVYAQQSPESEVSYTYDQLGRVISAAYIDRALGVGKTVDYSYDAAGNRTTTSTSDGYAINAYPVAVNDVVPLAYVDTPIIIAVLANDTDDNFGGLMPNVSSILTPASHGVAAITTGSQSITYTPTAGYTGPDSFVYEVTDGGGFKASASVSITVNGKVTFSLSANQTATEGQVKTFTISKAGVNVENQTVKFRTLTTGSAEVADFTAVDTLLTFTPTDVSKTITVSVANDNIWEYDDTVNVEIYQPSAQALLQAGASARTITITDAADKPTFTPANATFNESGGGNAVTFTLSNQSEQPIPMAWSWVFGTATQDDLCEYDMELLTWRCLGTSPFEFTLPAMATGGSISTSMVNDAVFEGPETFQIGFMGAGVDPIVHNPAGSSWATVTILDPEDGPSVSIGNAALVAEGGSATFTISLSQTSPVAITVDYATATGTAGSADFTAKSGTATILAGSLSTSVAVATTQDTTYEGNEAFTMAISNVSSGLGIATAQGTATITDVADKPSFAIGDMTATEGGNLTFTVTKTGATNLASSVNFATANGTAAAGSDYVAKSGTLSFPAGTTSLTVVVTGAQDTVYEGSETFYVNLSGAVDATIADAQGIGTITDNDAAPSFTVNNVTAAEGGTLTFTVTKTGSTALTHNVSYVTANNTALAGSDYVAKALTALSFPAATTSLTVAVTGVQDTVYEGSESFYLNLSSATNGATIADAQGVGTITDNDAAPSFAVNNVSAAEGGTLTFTVTKTGATAFTHNVSYATANNTALAGSDYVAKALTALSFPAATTSLTVAVTGVQDAVYEGSESFYLNLSSATNGATIADSQGVGTITNNDAAPSFAISNVTATEGGNLTFTVTKTGSTALTHNINYATANGTAAAGSDYVAKSGTLSFPAATSSLTVVVTGVQDTVCTEALNEYFYTNMSGATNGAAIADSQGVGYVTDNDNCIPVAVNDSDYSTTDTYDNRIFPLLNDSDADPEGNTLTITNVVKTSGYGSVSWTSTYVDLFIASCGKSGVFTYTISDGKGGTATATITIATSSCSGGGGGGPLL